MRARFAWATAIWVVSATSLYAQRYPEYSGPSLLPLPDATATADPYDPAAERYPGFGDGRAPIAREAVGGYPAGSGLSPYGYSGSARFPQAGWQPADAEPLPHPAADAGHGEAIDYGASHSPYAAALTDGCGESLNCPPPCCPWFGSIAGLVMSRDRGNKFWTSFESGNPDNQTLHSQQADADWRGGGEVQLGHYFGPCCNCGVAVTYWGLDALEGSAVGRNPNNTNSTPINLFSVTIGSDLATAFFDDATEHRLSRHNEIHNVELSFLTIPLRAGPCQRLQLTCFTGPRWFHFDETFQFASVAGGFEFGTTAGRWEAYLDQRVTNDLIGWQIGTRGDFFLTPRWRVFARPTFGVFGNHMSQRTHLYRGDGVEGFDLRSSKDDVSLVAQLDLGVAWAFTQRWSAFAAYRAVGVTGLALSDSQIPPFLIDAPAILDIDSNGSLILHGGIFGVQCNY